MPNINTIKDDNIIYNDGVMVEIKTTKKNYNNGNNDEGKNKSVLWVALLMDLPVAAHVNIFNFLDPDSLMEASVVCK